MSKKIEFDIDPSMIRDLFEGYSLTTLDSLGVILMWVRKYRMADTNEAFKEVYKGDTSGKWEDDFEDENYIRKVNNFDLSEVDKSINKLTDKQLKFLYDILEEAVSHMEPHDTIEMPIVPSILITTFNIKQKMMEEDKHRDRLTNKEMKDFFRKYDITELKSFEIIFRYVYENEDIGRIMHNRDEVLHAKMNTNPDDISEYSLSKLTAKNGILTDQELNFLLSLLSSAAFFLSVTSDLATIYEVTEDMEYDSYHRNAIYKMLEDTAADQEERLIKPVEKTIGTIA